MILAFSSVSSLLVSTSLSANSIIVFFFFFVIYLSSSLFSFFFFNDTATTEIYTLSLHDALPISSAAAPGSGSTRGTHCLVVARAPRARRSTRARPYRTPRSRQEWRAPAHPSSRKIGRAHV